MVEEGKLIDLMVNESDLNDEPALKGLVCRAVSAVRPVENDVSPDAVDSSYAPKKKWKAHYLRQGNDSQDFQAFFQQQENAGQNPPAGNNVQPPQNLPHYDANLAPVPEEAGAPDGANGPKQVPPLPEPVPSLPIVVEPRLELPTLPNGQAMAMAIVIDPPNLPSTSKIVKAVELPKPHLLVPPAGVSMVYSDPQSGMIVERILDVPAPAVVVTKAKSNNRTNDTSNVNNGASTSTAGQSGQGTREVHNRLEKYRRAQLKECYDDLKKVLPNISETRKVSNLIVLRNAHKYIQSLKRKEKEYEHEMDRLARKKIEMSQMYLQLRDEVARMYGSEKIIDWDELEAVARTTVERRRAPAASNPVQQGPSSAMASYQWRHEQRTAPRADEDGDSNTSTASECADMEDYEFIGSGASTSSGFSERRSNSSSSCIGYHQSPAGSASSSRPCSNGKASPGVKRLSPPTSRYPGGAKRVSPMMYPPTPPTATYNSMSSAASLPASPPMHAAMHSPKCFSVPPGGAHFASVVAFNPAEAGQVEMESRHVYQPQWAQEVANVRPMVERSPQHVISPQPAVERQHQEYSIQQTPRHEEEGDVLDLSLSAAKSQQVQQPVQSPPSMRLLAPSPAPLGLPAAVYYQRQVAGLNGFDQNRVNYYSRQFSPSATLPVREPAGPYMVSPGGTHQQQRSAPQPISYQQHQDALRHLRLQPEDAAKMPSDPAFQAALRANMGLPPLGPGMPFPPPRPPDGVKIKIPPHPLEMNMSAFPATAGGVRMIHPGPHSMAKPSMIHLGHERLSPASGPPNLMMPSGSHGLPNGIHVAKVPHGSPMELGRVTMKPSLQSPILTSSGSGPIMSAPPINSPIMPHHANGPHQGHHVRMLITGRHQAPRPPMNNHALPPMVVPFINNAHHQHLYRPAGIVAMPSPMPQQSRCDAKPVLT